MRAEDKGKLKMGQSRALLAMGRNLDLMYVVASGQGSDMFI